MKLDIPTLAKEIASATMAYFNICISEGFIAFVDTYEKYHILAKKICKLDNSKEGEYQRINKDGSICIDGKNYICGDVKIIGLGNL